MIKVFSLFFSIASRYQASDSLRRSFNLYSKTPRLVIGVACLSFAETTLFCCAVDFSLNLIADLDLTSFTALSKSWAEQSCDLTVDYLASKSSDFLDASS